MRLYSIILFILTMLPIAACNKQSHEGKVSNIQVVLTWRPSPSPSPVKGYHVWRRCETDKTSVMVATTSKLSWVDKAPKLSCFYSVSAFSDEGESLPSEEVSPQLKNNRKEEQKWLT